MTSDDRNEYSIFSLLFVTCKIICVIKEQAQSNTSLPQDPLNIVNQVMLKSKNEDEIKARLRKFFPPEILNDLAMIEYTLLKNDLQKKIPLEYFDDYPGEEEEKDQEEEKD
jgi:hypothetical protein